MKIEKKDLEKSQLEITVELSADEFAPYVDKGAKKLAAEVKIEGFRPGKAPLEVLKQKVGEMAILEEAANIAVRKTLDEAIKKGGEEQQAVGQPQVNITKLAPNNPFEYKITVTILPTIILGKYKELKLKVEEAKIDDQELDKALGDLREMRATEALVDRGAQDGDKVMVDIKMLLDKVPVENGDYKDLAISMGKNYFVTGFDEQIKGAKKGEEKKFDLVFPESHHQKNLAGKNVSFEVKIKDVYERVLPELNDEFAKGFQLKDLAELKTNLKDSLLLEKKRNIDTKNESMMIEKIVTDTKFGEIPEILIENESQNMLAELEQSVVRQGGEFADYLSHLKKTTDELRLEMLPNAVKRVKSALVIREIALQEKIEVSHEDIHQKIDELEKQYQGNEEVLKMLHEEGYHSYLSSILTNEKVLEKLKAWNYGGASQQQKS
ncbi:MAG: trigger factor [Patescibacteria group bacterium]|jgi:trigger factor